MLNTSNKIKRYDFNKKGYSHYVKINREITETEYKTLEQILVSFPYPDKKSKRFEKFHLLDFKSYPKELLFIAANAYDDFGNTVLGVACEYGKDIKAVQQLIDGGCRH